MHAPAALKKKTFGQSFTWVFKKFSEKIFFEVSSANLIFKNDDFDFL